MYCRLVDQAGTVLVSANENAVLKNISTLVGSQPSIVDGTIQDVESGKGSFQGLIEELQFSAKAAVDQMAASHLHTRKSQEIAKDASERLQTVTDRMSQIDGQNLSVATVTEEQSAVVDTLNQDINQISDLNGKNIENAKSSLAACVALDEEAIRL